MKGSELKKIIKDSGFTIDEIAVKSTIAKRTISSLYDKDYVEKHYVDKLNFLLQKDAINDISHNSDNEILQAELAWRKQNEKDLRKTIEILELNNQTLNKLINKQLT